MKEEPFEQNLPKEEEFEKYDDENDFPYLRRILEEISLNDPE